MAIPTGKLGNVIVIIEGMYQAKTVGLFLKEEEYNQHCLPDT